LVFSLFCGLTNYTHPEYSRQKLPLLYCSWRI
jgi:hypothetical protein